MNVKSFLILNNIVLIFVEITIVYEYSKTHFFNPSFGQS